MELETAVRLKANVLHLIWVDNGYNMVAIGREKYQRLSGVEFGPMDFKAYAESFGAKGFAVEAPRRWSRPCARRWTSTARRWPSGGLSR